MSSKLGGNFFSPIEINEMAAPCEIFTRPTGKDPSDASEDASGNPISDASDG